jgi:hypothetical protein
MEFSVNLLIIWHGGSLTLDLNVEVSMGVTWRELLVKVSFLLAPQKLSNYVDRS